MYTEANRAIYETLEASLLFWEKLIKILEETGYQRNKYDWCGMNKILNYRQCTIIWHVDDLKVSHVNPDIVSNILLDIDA